MKRPVPPVRVRTPVEGQVHTHPLMDRILRNRNVSDISELNYRLSDLLPPNMKGMDQAVAIIAKHLLADSKILILGDYDCDGATATSIAMEGLSLLGAKNVEFLVPDRAIHGYGLTPAIVALAEEQEPNLIITVDNGIASFAGAKAVKEMRRPCELVITDHHLTVDSGELPDADAIVNPNQAGCPFESKNIAGCGVMFYTILALRAYMRKEGVFEARDQLEPNLECLLDLVALGTVADVVSLDRNNRILISAGLARINAGNGRPGVNALLAAAKRTIGEITAQDFGFGAGPRLNAAGRLEDMSKGIRCLLCQDPIEAGEIAEELDELNLTRREIEADMVLEAEEAAQGYQDDGSDAVILYNSGWHEGVVGIVSSRIKERCNRPTICFTDTKEAHELADAIDAATNDSEREKAEAAYANRSIKGSGRSVPGVHLKHALDRIYKKHPEVVGHFGGHSMACGMTIPAKHLERFRELLNLEVKEDLTDDIRSGRIEIDLEGLADEDRSVDTAKMIAAHGPWGQHFTEPVFKDRFVVEGVKVMKDVHLKLQLRQENSDTVIEGVAFNVIESPEDLEHLGVVDVVYKLDVNRFRHRENLQIMIEHISPAGCALVQEAGLEGDKSALTQQAKAQPVSQKQDAGRERRRPTIALPF